MTTARSSHAPATRLRTVVVGLGQVGSRFDEEPGRRGVQSHVGAYLHLADKFTLCAVAEVSSPNAAAFRTRCPSVPVYTGLDELIARHRPEVASICTPAETHGEVLFKLLASKDMRLIWCEKPLSVDWDEARRMVDACRDQGVRLMVSFNRRWQPLWQRARTLVHTGSVGTVRSIRVAFPNRLYSIGSHAVDLALMFGGPLETITALPLPALEEACEPAVAALLRYGSGAGGIIQVTGFKAQLIVEAEVIGDEGRLWVREDRSRITIERFVPSANFVGYRQLGTAEEDTIDSPADFSAFIAMAGHAAAALNDGAPIICDGAYALEVQRILGLMNRS
ncbi:MAG: Gfo/Idh/MocA family protein [Xanthobacteraceae bacterium]